MRYEIWIWMLLGCWKLGAILSHYFHYRTFVRGKLPHFFFFFLLLYFLSQLLTDNSLLGDQICYQKAAKIIIGVFHESAIVGQIALTETRYFFESFFIFL